MNGKWHVSGGQILAHTLTQTLILGSSFIIPRYCTLNSMIFVDQCVRPLEWAKGKKCDSNFFISLLNRKWKQTNKLTVPLGVCVCTVHILHTSTTPFHVLSFHFAFSQVNACRSKEKEKGKKNACYERCCQQSQERLQELKRGKQ